MEKIRKFLKGKEGVIAVEYALITGFIGLGLVAVISAWESQLHSIFTQLTNFLSQDGTYWCTPPGCH